MVEIGGLKKKLFQQSPGWERLIFGGAMLGLLDAAHFWVQKSRSFEGGCSGLASLGEKASAGQALFDCAAVTSGPGSELLGVSNAA